MIGMDGKSESSKSVTLVRLDDDDDDDDENYIIVYRFSVLDINILSHTTSCKLFVSVSALLFNGTSTFMGYLIPKPFCRTVMVLFKP